MEWLDDVLVVLLFCLGIWFLVWFAGLHDHSAVDVISVCVMCSKWK